MTVYNKWGVTTKTKWGVTDPISPPDDIEQNKGSNETKNYNTEVEPVSNLGENPPEPPERKQIHCCDTSTKQIAWGVFVLAILITVICLLATSFEKLDSTQQGVEYNVHSKTLADAAKTGGLHAGPPSYRFIKFPSTFITEDLPDGICVSQDGLRVEFSVTFQYSMPEAWLLPAILKYRNFGKWADVVGAAGTSAVQHSCSEFTISSFQNKRGIIQATMEDNLRIKLEGLQEDGSDGVYARVVSLSLKNVELPLEYQTAIQEKQNASEDIALAINQRNQELTKARTQLLTATEEAHKILDNAENNAELILAEASLKANETIFAYEKEAEVLVKVKNALNLDTDGVLSFMSNMLIANVQNIKVSGQEPGNLSRKSEL
mmetsp:Transcript_24683/g.44676  ORF Transcript_24683/g.44676 Transcript_24683/m.44676 type:complete len:376 (-) Transcript_24683:110-1237(-)|eukprot:CAMPEP_0198283580 /NCGR_PEP_ID=MMETSP1449-20131203/3150_1 /TAXON_ID=420275 /ORGANISM="Attheya septentrionalis, Strain CCMP2084" /LENGTH=375 /DNA_ID=CAMNT_0043980255 /DNA_START=138 /DNA_END=1265 /DNA_ORIENTATION=+